MTANQLIDNLGILYIHLELSNNTIGESFYHHNCKPDMCEYIDAEIDIRIQEIRKETWGAHWLMAGNT